MIKTTFKHLKYRPSIVARMARIVLPVLDFLLPRFFYQTIYKLLYSLYKINLRFLYFLKFKWYSVFGDDKKKLKVKLTYQLLPYTMGGSKALENAFDLIFSIEKKKLNGAIVECGVAEGGTSAMMAMTSRLYSTIIRDKWLFDSFVGLPEPTKEDYVGGKTGNFVRPLPKGSCLGTIEQVSELMFDKLKFSRDEVFLVKGWFQKTLPITKSKIGKIAILRLDGDWYESTLIPLTNLFDQIVTGGYVIVDDYLTCYGSKKAVDEFLKDRGLKINLIQDGRGGVWFEKNKL